MRRFWVRVDDELHMIYIVFCLSVGSFSFVNLVQEIGDGPMDWRKTLLAMIAGCLSFLNAQDSVLGRWFEAQV